MDKPENISKTDNISKKQFIEQFVVNFLSTYAATEYNEICMQGTHERYDSMPVEDAIFLAKKAWDQFNEHMNYDRIDEMH